MATDERSRHELYRRLEELLGLDLATTLMEHLPPTGWGDVATKTDIALVRADLDVLRAEMSAEFSAVRSEMTTGLGGVNHEIDLVGSEMSAGLSAVRSEIDLVRSDMTSAIAEGISAAISQQTRTIIFSLIATIVALNSMFYGVTHLP